MSAEHMQKQIRLRVVAVLKLWIRDFWSDFESSSELTYLLLHWLQIPLEDKFFQSVCDGLTQTLMKNLSGNMQEKVHSLDVSQFPPALIPKEVLRAAPDDLDPFSLDPLELARQISLVEQQLFQNIEPKELLNQNWNKPNKTISAPHVSALVTRVNLMSSWLMNSIVCQAKHKQRSKRIEKWIRVALACRELQNLNAVMEILSGLGVTCVYRLRKSWAAVDPRLVAQYEELRTLMSPTQNSAAYRAHMRSINPPCIPYIGVVLTDLTFTDDGMTDFLDDQKTIINFHKRQKTASLVEGLLHFRYPQYALRPIPFIQQLIEKKWTNPASLASQETLLAISRVLE